MRTRPDGHTPTRTCVGCRQRRPAPELLRCIWRHGRIEVDRTGPGRGAWVCGRACVEAARRRNGFDRAWRHPVPSEAIDALLARWE